MHQASDLGQNGEGRRSWRHWLTMSRFVMISVSLVVVVSFLIVGVFGYRALLNNKLRDVWALQYLELESFVKDLNFKEFGQVGEKYLYQLQDNTLVSQYSSEWKLEDFSLDARTLKAYREFDQILLSADGIVYLAEFYERKSSGPNSQIYLSQISPIRLKRVLGQVVGEDQGLVTRVYAVSREGRLIYSNDPAITPANMIVRPLVQKFVKAPLSEGQLEFSAADGEGYYGFFQEVRKSNVILFAETSKAGVVHQVRSTISRFALFCGIVLIFTLLLLQLPLDAQTKPLRRLLASAKLFAEGDFYSHTAAAKGWIGFGEVKLLNESFGAMWRALAAREQKIISLARAKEEQLRLSRELIVAQSIQNNFMPKDAQHSGDQQKHVDIAARYQPAAEVAGDWWGYHHDEERRETIVAIADVMGHGAGSAMFTAVIASIFDEYRHGNQSGFVLKEFAEKLNRTLCRLGGGEWDVSMAIVKHSAKSKILDILLAGHTPPLLVTGEKQSLPYTDRKGKKIASRQRNGVSSVLLSGEILGHKEDARFDEGSIPFEHDATLVLYTDGLTEVRNPDGRMFGKAGLRRSVASVASASCEVLVESILKDWQQHKSEKDAEDDMCLVVLKAVA